MIYLNLEMRTIKSNIYYSKVFKLFDGVGVVLGVVLQ